MLYDEPVLFHGGFTIFRDFSDPNTFYFLPPEAPRIARTAEGGGDLALRLVLYRPDPNAPAPEGMEDGGGFLNVDVDLHVTETQLEEVRDEIRRKFGAEANLVPVPFRKGSVELVLLGVERGDENQPFVRKIAGTTVPALYGSQRAAFSTVLDRDGAALMRQVIEAGGATMALAVYHLTYAGIGPAYNLKITIDYKRVHEKLDLDLRAAISAGSSTSGSGTGGRDSSQSSFVGKAGFHLLIESLKESRAILVEEVDPVPGENGQSGTNQQQINEIIGNLMGSKWFKPTLAAGSQLTQLAGSAGSGSSSGTAGSGGTAGGSSPAPSGSGGATPGPSGSTPSDGDEGEATGENAAQRPPAAWTEVARTPAQGFPEGRSVSHTPAPSGLEETLIIVGEGATATLDGQSATLQGGTRLVAEVQPGQTRQVTLTWPGGGQPPAPKRFHLFFDYERPRGNPPADARDEVPDYSAGTPNPAEGPSAGEQPRFLEESRASGSESGAARGPAALRTWLDALDTRDLVVNAFASYEQREDRRAYNQALSERRRQVARNLVGNGFNFTGGSPHGHDTAKNSPSDIPTLSDDSAPANSRGGRPQHRVVIIEPAAQAPAAAATTISGTLRRPPLPEDPDPPERRTAEATSSKLEASFEINLEIIKREEHITAVYELNTRKARLQEVHPQGQLMLDVANPLEYILEADGAIAFFQSIEVSASTTAQWERDGIVAVHVQLRYGPRAEGGFERHDELVLKPEQLTDEWKVNVLHDSGDPGLPIVYWYEYRVTIHYRPDVALGDQTGAVTSQGVEGADPEGWFRTTERNLVIHPRDVTNVVAVNIATGIMRFDLLDRVQCVLSYGPHRQNLTLAPDSRDHQLVIRVEEDLAGEPLRTEGTLFYKDGAQVPLVAQEWTPQELIVINEPRENLLRVSLLLADPVDEYERVEVNLKYEAGDRLVESDVTLTEHAQMEEWSVRLEDLTARTWSYQATLIKRSGDIDRVEWTDTEADQVILGIQASDVIPVQVTWLAIPLPEGLLAVKVDMLYEDEANGLRWEHSELIRGEHPGGFTWSIPIQDATRRSYRYRVSEFRSSGQLEGEWIEASERQLVLLPGS